MARVIHYPNDFSFRPFRNLPPVNLAQDVPPEEPATILLLECRDPGSILHTIHHGLSNPCRCLCDYYRSPEIDFELGSESRPGLYVLRQRTSNLRFVYILQKKLYSHLTGNQIQRGTPSCSRWRSTNIPYQSFGTSSITSKSIKKPFLSLYPKVRNSSSSQRTLTHGSAASMRPC